MVSSGPELLVARLHISNKIRNRAKSATHEVAHRFDYGTLFGGHPCPLWPARHKMLSSLKDDKWVGHSMAALYIHLILLVLPHIMNSPRLNFVLFRRVLMMRPGIPAVADRCHYARNQRDLRGLISPIHV